MQSAGLYIHIPFCERKCGYCDFYSITSLQRRDDFVTALLREIELLSPPHQDLHFDTVFFGGGTPTTLSISQLESIWNHLHKHFSIAADGEFSMEANPGTIDSEKLLALRRMGINRLSMGVQSFDSRDLKFLGRIHTVDDVLENYESARKAGFENINLDLMTAFPGLTAERFQSTLEKAADLQPEHISCYTLIFEPDTPFFARMKRGELQPPDNEEEAAFYEAANTYLASRGYSAYEISNYSRTRELRCRHNLRYWNHEPYLGLGPSAHSFLTPQRWWNVRPLTAYIKKLSGNELPVKEQETLDAATLEFEYIFLRLRLKEGIDLSDFEKRFHNNFIQRYKKVVDSLLKNELVIQNEERLQLSDKGWLLADEIARAF